MGEQIKKYKIGLTFGAFDGLHFGHLNLFIRAKELCDYLIVCMSDDEYIEKNKDHKPMLSFQDRFTHLSAISTNIIDLIDIQTPYYGKKEAVRKYSPDVLFVGTDWDSNTYKGEGLGVKVEYLPRTPDISSTLLREKSKKDGLML